MNDQEKEKDSINDDRKKTITQENIIKVKTYEIDLHNSNDEKEVRKE